MVLITGIAEIPELNKSSVHIKDSDGLIKKINKIIKDGDVKLQILTDFDLTLTRPYMDDGTTVLNSFGMFRACPSVPQDFKNRDIELANRYKPVIMDPVMSTQEKIKHVEEWHNLGRGLLKGIKFPREELIEVSNKMVNCFRKGVSELISWCEVHNVPMLVFSAGFGECVESSLKAAGFIQPHVKVISNFHNFDENDLILGPKGEFIHAYNKNETALKNTEYYEMVKERNNVILMGDSIGDAGMADGMDHCDVIIKIGFLGRGMDDNLQNYVNEFDIVLVDDHTMNVVNAILKKCL